MSKTLTQIEAAIVENMIKSRRSRASNIRDLLNELRVPGLSFVTIRNGLIDCIGVYGVLASGESEVVTPNTLFQAASISKPIAAMTILGMVEEGLLDLDTDVNAYLTSWRLPPVDGWQPHITLRQLLSHMAATTVGGFRGYTPAEALPTITQILDGTEPAINAPVRVYGLPGLGFSYSGGGTMLAQLVAMDVSGKDFHTLARDRVLEPLGMIESDFSQPLPPHKHQLVARGHLYTGHPVPGGWYVMPELAAAGLWTNPSELSRFLIALQQAHRGQHPDISQQIANWMLTPVADAIGNKVCLGLFVNDEGKEMFFEHAGGNIGYQCLLRGLVDRPDGVISMTNGDMGGEICHAIWDASAEVYGWKATAEDNIVHDATECVGTYVCSTLEFRIEQSGDQLRLHLKDQEVLPLNLNGKRLNALDMVLTPERDSSGNLIAFHIVQGSQNVTAKRQV